MPHIANIHQTISINCAIRLSEISCVLEDHLLEHAVQTMTIYQGKVNIPGIDNIQDIVVTTDPDSKSVEISLSKPVNGHRNWFGQSVTIARKLKYEEIICQTEHLPVNSVRLTWKFNASHQDNSVAGVVIAQPNDLRIRGEIGFVLNQT